MDEWLAMEEVNYGEGVCTRGWFYSPRIEWSLKGFHVERIEFQ